MQSKRLKRCILTYRDGPLNGDHERPGRNARVEEGDAEMALKTFAGLTLNDQANHPRNFIFSSPPSPCATVLVRPRGSVRSLPLICGVSADDFQAYSVQHLSFLPSGHAARPRCADVPQQTLCAVG